MSKELERLKNKNLPCANCKALEALKNIKEFNAYSIEQIQGQWYLFRGIANVRNTDRKPIDEETAMLLREVLL